jgi:hypothetical protein
MYVFDIAETSAAVWTVVHNLSNISLSPRITLVDSNDNIITTNAIIAVVDDNTFTATFTSVQAGRAIVVA